MKRAVVHVFLGFLFLSPTPAFADSESATVLIWPMVILAAGLAIGLYVFWKKNRALRIELSEVSERSIRQSETLSEAETRLSQISAVLDAIPMPVWWRDESLRLLGCNRAYSESLEMDTETILAEARELGAGAIDDKGQGLAAQAQQMGIPLSESHYVVHRGERRLLDFTEIPLKGQTAIVAGHAIDVTAMENVQSELSSHIAAHGDVLESLATAIAIFGPDRRLKFYNRAFVELWHLEASALDTEPQIGELLELLRENRQLPELVDFPAFKQEQDRLFVSVIERREELMHLPDGRTFRMAITPHPFGGLLFVYEDVTDSLVLERPYNTLIEVQLETINNLHEGVAVYGQDGRLRLWNETLVEMWKFDHGFLEAEPHVGEMLERTKDLFPPTDNWNDRKQRLILQVTEGSTRAGQFERADGFVYDYACVPLPDGGCLLSYVDVTDTARVQRALEERNLALEMADQVKTEFIANVSYELRTPLNTIAGFADVLEGQVFGDLNQRQTEYIDGIVTASHQLRELIDDILDLATIEAGYMALDLQLVEISNILQEARDMAAKRIESGRLKLEVDCASDVGAARVDAARMTKALYNLLWNSVMFQSDDGIITLRGSLRGDEIIIEVDDSSGLVTQDELGDLYETFEHGDPYVRRSGAGLGLALTRSLVELHGGQLEIHNDPEGGTRAIASFPTAGPVPVTSSSRQAR